MIWVKARPPFLCLKPGLDINWSRHRPFTIYAMFNHYKKLSKMENKRFYNRTLSAAEIRSEYLKHSLVINENNYLTYYAGNLTLNTSINPSKWYHIAGTYNDNGEANLFLDGINLESNYNGPKIKSNLYKAWIGSWSGLTNEFNGTIDNVTIYSKVLSNQTIKSHFERGLKTYSLNRLRTTSTKEQWNKTIMTNLRIVE